MKIYTGDGDELTTSLMEEAEIKKNDIRIRFIGDLEELNGYLGVVKASGCHAYIKNYISIVQETVLVIMYSAKGAKCTIQYVALTDLEEQIDFLDTLFKRDTKLSLPGNTLVSAYIDLARAVARRAERSLAEFCENNYYIDPIIKKYINRLSDYLFVAARFMDSLDLD